MPLDLQALEALVGAETPHLRHISALSEAFLLSAIEDYSYRGAWSFGGDPVSSVQWDKAEALLASTVKELSVNTMIGTIYATLTATPPPLTLPLDGATYNAADYPALYAVIDAAFKTGINQFTLPDLSGKFLRGADLSAAFGTFGGASQATLTIDNLPPHDHTTLPHAHSVSDTFDVPIPIVGADPIPYPLPQKFPSSTGFETVTVNPTGSGVPFDTQPPFIAIRWVIVYA